MTYYKTVIYNGAGSFQDEGCTRGKNLSRITIQENAQQVEMNTTQLDLYGFQFANLTYVCKYHSVYMYCSGKTLFTCVNLTVRKHYRCLQLPIFGNLNNFSSTKINKTAISV